MDQFFLNKKLAERRAAGAFRTLQLPAGSTDLCSNDYLGIARRRLISAHNHLATGSAGSRLLAGHFPLAEKAEALISAFHQARAGLLFNSGYDANTGLLSSVPQRGDTVFYDRLCHASLRDGIRLSFARAQAFHHNDPEHLAQLLPTATGNTFIVTESVFSMDGDICPAAELVALAEKHGAHLIIDEAHATGVIGERGEGLVQHLGLQEKVFARIHTFGKACGVHGAIVLGSALLRDYLINFARSFIYSTSLPEAAVQSVIDSYALFPGMTAEREKLRQLIQYFKKIQLPFQQLHSDTPIQGILVPGNEAVVKLAEKLQARGLDIRPIRYPTVPKGGERLRIVLHSFNETAELDLLAV